MMEQETIDIMCDLWDDISHHHTDCETLWSEEREEAFSMVMSALEEIQQYRAMEQRLRAVYGDCDGLLETVVAGLEKHEGTEIPEPITKARLLTDGMVDMWEEYKAIGTVEECREAVEKQKAKKPIQRTHCKDGNHPLPKDIGRCPTCNYIVSEDMIWCDDCGQKLDWNEDEET